MNIKEKVNLNNIINFILVIMLIGTNIYAGMLCGSYLKSNVQVINMLLNIIVVVSILYNCIIKKKFKINKLDICVFILSLSSLIPLLFKTYSSIQDTIQYVLWYISVLNIYIITKSVIYSNPKYKNMIIYGTILISVILVIIAIDDVTNNYFEELKLSLDTIVRYSSSTRLEAVFRYPNSFASCICFAMFLTIGKAITCKNKIIKPILESIIFIQAVAILLSGSRLTLLVFTGMILLYMIVLKRKEENLNIIKILGINFIIALLFSKTYLEGLENANYMIIWNRFFIMFITAFIIHLLSNILLEKIYKVQTKKIVIFASAIVLIGVIAFVILLQIDTQIILENNISTQNTISRKIYDIEPNKEYDFKFDINTYKEENKYCLYEILIKQYNKYEEFIVQDRIVFEDIGEQEKNIKIVTNKETAGIKVVFRTKNQQTNVKMKIKKLEINGKKHIIEYKYLPTTLINRFGSEVSETKSTWQRFIFVQDGLKVASKNILFGSGGNGWLYNYKEVQEYNYTSRDVHSHPIQILIQDGIIGFLAYIGIIVILILYIKKLKKENRDIINITILFTIINIMFHSFLDMDMSYFYNLITTFMYIAIISYEYKENKEKENKNKIFFIIMEIILVITLIFNIRVFTAERMMKEINGIYNFDEKVEKMEKIIKLNPYKYEYRKRQIDNLEYIKYYTEIDEKRNKEVSSKLIKHIEFMIKNDLELYNSNYYTIILECYAESINKENADDIINKIKNIIGESEKNKKIILNEEDIYLKLVPIMIEKKDYTNSTLEFYKELERRKII